VPDICQLKSKSLDLQPVEITSRIEELLSIQETKKLGVAVLKLKSDLQLEDKESLVLSDEVGITVKTAYLIKDLEQIYESHTIERAHHYCTQLLKGLSKTKYSNYSDINLNRWKEYDDIETDSLWIFKNRDRSGAHNSKYWGNYIPQIPNQLLQRYTKANDWVLDPFLGSGTTLIECKKLGRNAIGVELQKHVARIAEKNVKNESNLFTKNVVTEIINDDSASVDLNPIKKKLGIDNFQFIMYHPPYWDIIQFSELESDLSNASTLEEFLNQFKAVLDNTLPHLEKDRFFAIVISDKYEKGEWIPLGFETMQMVKEQGHLLKSVIVKNFDTTKGKQSQEGLWRYRALAGGFYIFKHEYIFLFQKKN